MRFSARRTERSRGFSLLEVIVAASIFSVIMIVALSQIKESGDAAKLSTVQADLRKQGEKCLNDVVRDLRSSLAPYAGAGLATGTGTASPANSIQFCKVAGYNATTKLPLLFGDLKGTVASGIDAPGVTLGTPITGNAITNNGTFIFGYSQPAGSNNLVFSYGTKTAWAASTQTNVILSSELASIGDTQPTVAGTVDGFSVAWTTGQATKLLVSSGAPIPFYDQPTQLTVKLVLKRRISGKVAAGVAEQFAWTTVQTIVQLRADENY